METYTKIFTPLEYFGGEERYKRTKELDKLKNKLCQDNNVSILYYSHYNYDYDFEILTTIEELKNKIYGSFSKN